MSYSALYLEYLKSPLWKQRRQAKLEQEKAMREAAEKVWGKYSPARQMGFQIDIFIDCDMMSNVESNRIGANNPLNDPYSQQVADQVLGGLMVNLQKGKK